jgi:tetratricopeptide (TPR) repeat protein
MLEKKKETLKGKFINAVENFFRAKTLIIWIILGIAVVGFIVFTAWTEVDKKINEEATAKVESAEDDYSNWLYEKDEKKKTVLEEQLLASLDKIIRDYPARFAALKASVTKAKYFAAKKDWEKSARYFMETAKGFPKAFIAAECMVNAASAYEEMSDPDKAIKTYNDVLSTYKDSYEVPYVLFSLGRINEQKKNYQEANKYYSELEDKHSMSSWTLIAQNRKIYLKSMGY